MRRFLLDNEVPPRGEGPVYEGSSPGGGCLGRSLVDQGLWPPIVPTVVLVKSLLGDPARDAKANRFLEICIVQAEVTPAIARRAAELRRLARTGSAVDALVVAVAVALAEPGGTVLTGDKADIEALAAHAGDVSVELV